MRTVSTGIATAQKAATCTPYISVTFMNGVSGTTIYQYDTADSPRRIKNIKHVEEPYNDYAIIVLTDELDDLPSLVGFYTTIDYGYKVSGTPDTTGGESAPLWVTKQFKTSKPGSKDTILYCEGAWAILSRAFNVGSLLGGTAPYYEVDYSAEAYTVYDIIKAVLDSLTFDLLPLGIHDDSVIDTLQPAFVTNSVPFEDARQQVYRLINMTKCMIRVERTTNTQSESVIAVGQNYYPSQRKEFYVLGLYWVFYQVNVWWGIATYFKTSPDKVEWSAATYISTTADTGIAFINFDFFVDVVGGVTYIHYVLASQIGGVRHRVGTMGAGTITWGTEETISARQTKDGVTMLVDSNHLYVIGYVSYWASQPYWYVMCEGFAEVRLGTTIQNWSGCCAPTTDGKTVMIYGYAGGALCGRVWDGSNWSAEDTSDSVVGPVYADGNLATIPASIVCVGTIAHIVFFTDASTIVHLTMDSATGLFSAETVVQSGLDSGASNTDCPILSKDSSNNLYCFWYKDDSHVYYKIRNAGTGVWGSVVDLGAFDIDVSGDNDDWSGFDTLPNDEVIFVYQTTGGVLKMTGVTPAAYQAQFRIIYPAIWDSYHATYYSESPTYE
jgi:hypothetical protein